MTDEEKKKPGLTIGIVGTGASAMGVIAALSGQRGPVSHAEVKDEVPIEPSIKGEHGRAWRIDTATALRRYGFKVEDQGTIAAWCVEVPWAHPVWHSYILILVHLRPTKHTPTEAKLYFPGATHEFWLWASDPDKPRIEWISGAKDPAHLSPMNFGAQLKQSTDGGAIAVMAKTVQDICDGKLSPDTDYLTQWRERFGSATIKKEYR